MNYFREKHRALFQEQHVHSLEIVLTVRLPGILIQPIFVLQLDYPARCIVQFPATRSTANGDQINCTGQVALKLPALRPDG